MSFVHARKHRRNKDLESGTALNPSSTSFNQLRDISEFPFLHLSNMYSKNSNSSNLAAYLTRKLQAVMHK